MTINIGSAILILGVIWLHFAYGLDLTVTILLGGLGGTTWAYYGLSDERKHLLKAQIEYYKAKAEYYKRKTGEGK